MQTAGGLYEADSFTLEEVVDHYADTNHATLCAIMSDRCYGGYEKAGRYAMFSRMELLLMIADTYPYGFNRSSNETI